MDFSKSMESLSKFQGRKKRKFFSRVVAQSEETTKKRRRRLLPSFRVTTSLQALLPNMASLESSQKT